MPDIMTSDRRFDHFGLESPFSSRPSSSFGYEQSVWQEQEKPVAPVTGSADDPPGLAAMLAIRGRFDDPKRDPALEMDGTRFADFLAGRDRRQFAASWLASRPGLALAASEPSADLAAGDITKAWFIIHDIGAEGSTPDRRYVASNPKNRKSVHGYLNRGGYYAAIFDFTQNKMGTVFEFLSRKGREICGGKTINIETAPDVEKVVLRQNGTPPPASHPERYASIGYRKTSATTANYYKWTHEAFDVLADLYILASIRAGHLLTVTAHKEVDRNLAKSVIWREYDGKAKEFRTSTDPWVIDARTRPSRYHGDPYGFDMQAFYDCVTRKLNALGGRQMPAGARYGIHPLRLRKANGLDIMNGSTHRHEFPHQSDPAVKNDGNLKKDGWWNAGTSGESWDEAPWSQAEWTAMSGAGAGRADEWHTVESEEKYIPCGDQKHEDNLADDPGETEGLDWLDLEGETAQSCPHCGGQTETYGDAGFAADDEFADENDFETGDSFADDEFDGENDEYGVGGELHELDPALLGLAERIMASETPDFEHDTPRRWSRCFPQSTIDKLEQAYKDNKTAADADSGARCSCIVMLNVGLGALLDLIVTAHPARSSSSRQVQMPKLPTESIQKAMAALLKKGYATGPRQFNFFDRRRRTAGTLRPETLKASVKSYLVSASSVKDCWYAYGLSILDGYHSVMLLVHRTASGAQIFWLDQFSDGLSVDVTSNLDERLTERTQTFWDGVMAAKNKGYNTVIQIWPLQRPIPRP